MVPWAWCLALQTQTLLLFPPDDVSDKEEGYKEVCHLPRLSDDFDIEIWILQTSKCPHHGYRDTSTHIVIKQL